MGRFYFPSYDQGEWVVGELRHSMTTNADYDGWEDTNWGEGRLVKTSVGRIAEQIREISARQGVQLKEGDDIPKSTFMSILYPES